MGVGVASAECNVAILAARSQVFLPMLRLVSRQAKLPAGVRFAQGTGRKVNRDQDKLKKSYRIPGSKGYRQGPRENKPSVSGTNAAALTASDAPPKQYKYEKITARDPEDQHHINHFEKTWHMRRRMDQRLTDAELGFPQKKPKFIREAMTKEEQLSPEMLEEYMGFDLENEIVYGVRGVLVALKTRVVKKVFLGGRKSPESREILETCIDNDIPLLESQDVRKLIKAYDLHSAVTNAAIAEVMPRDLAPELFTLPYNKDTKQYSFGLSSSVQVTRGRKPYPVGVYLDQVTDTYNIGAILRTCYYVGVDFVIIGGTRGFRISDNIVRASAGAADFVRIGHVADTMQFLESLSPLWQLISTVVPKRTGPAENSIRLNDLESISAKGPTLLMVGSEDHGLRPQVAKLARHKCTIVPVAGVDSMVDSLNVSVAAALAVERLTSNVREDEVMRDAEIKNDSKNTGYDYHPQAGTSGSPRRRKRYLL